MTVIPFPRKHRGFIDPMVLMRFGLLIGIVIGALAVVLLRMFGMM